jgi:hypothetical protein
MGAISLPMWLMVPGTRERMMNRIDFRLLGIAGAILAFALTVAWAATALFRSLFPSIAAETIWDELTGPTIASLVIIGIKVLLYREKIFHLLVTMDVPDIRRVTLYLPRRGNGWGLLLMPRYQREAMINDSHTFIRNIHWWGVYGVDRCTMCIKFDNHDTNCRYVELPRSLYRAHATIRVHLSEVSEQQTLIVSPQHVE